jgi:hypothetical protein
MDYETGLLVAFFIWLWGLAMMVLNVNSQMNRNLQKVGIRISWLTFSPKPMTKAEQVRPFWKHVLKFLLLAAIGIPFIFLSWLQVVIFIGTVLYKHSKDSGAPELVREFRWKLRNSDLTMDQVIRELMKVQEVPPDQFDQFKTEVIDDMIQRGLTVGAY